MAGTDQVWSRFDADLPALSREHQVPAASVAVLRGDEIASTAAGVLSVDNGVPATEDTVFRIGAIAEVFTATLVMQLVDEGLIVLDAPVRRYLPRFRLADPEAAQRITIRQLLTHTAGFDTDLPEVGLDDTADRHLAEELPEAAQLFAPGELYSYNDAGFVVLGRLVEVTRGMSYTAALQRHLTDPLGMEEVAIDTAEAIARPAAVGHVKSDGDIRWRPAPGVSTPGLSAGQLMRLARLHLADGVAPDGTRLLSPESVRAMRTPQVGIPRSGPLRDHHGLAWQLPGTARGPLAWRRGDTVGQAAILVLAPEADVAVAVLTNGGDHAALRDTVLDRLLGGIADTAQPPSFSLRRPPPPIPDPSRFTGRYAGRAGAFRITAADGELWMTADAETRATVPNTGSRRHHRLLRMDGDVFVSVADGEIVGGYAFIGTDERGRARYLHSHRAYPRVA